MFVWFAAAVVAQDVAPLRVRIETSAEGMTRVSGASLKAFHPIERIAPDRLCLTRDGAPVALHVQGGADGRLDPADDLYFYAPAPRDPRSKTETFILSEQGRPWFYRPGEVSADVAPPAGDPAQIRVVQTVDDKRAFDPLNTLREDVLRGPARPFWWTASIEPGASTEIVFDADLAPSRSAPAQLTLEFFGSTVDGTEARVGLTANGVALPEQTWTTPLEHTVTVSIPGGSLRPGSAVSIANRSPAASLVEPGDDLGRPKSNRLLLRSAALAFETRLVTPSTTQQQTVLHLVGSGSGKPRRIAVQSRIQGGFQLFDPTAARLWRGGEIQVEDRTDLPLAIVTAEGAHPPSAVARPRWPRSRRRARISRTAATTSW
jgi:hypothetical protein